MTNILRTQCIFSKLSRIKCKSKTDDGEGTYQPVAFNTLKINGSGMNETAGFGFKHILFAKQKRIGLGNNVTMPSLYIH